jgi:DNA topoisomerase-1
MEKAWPACAFERSHIEMARGWRRLGSRAPFRYVDEGGAAIADEAALARIRSLAIPPAWREVWISPDPGAKLQATGVDAKGRRQYRYHPDFVERRQQAKFDRLVRFGEHLPSLRAAMSEHMRLEPLEREHVAAIALRLIDEGWFRVGSEKHLQRSGTYGIATLLKRQVSVHGPRVHLEFVGKHRIWVRRVLVDPELASAIRDLQAVPGGPRLFRYRVRGELHNLTSERLNRYVDRWLGEEFMCKDFRTWGGTLTAAVGFAERGPARTKADRRRTIAWVMRQVAERLGNTPAVARSSYVSPAVIEEYVEGRTIADVRPRGLRVLEARSPALTPEEEALLVLCRRSNQAARAAAASARTAEAAR